MVGPHYYDRLDLDFPQEEREHITARMQAHVPTKIAEWRSRPVRRTEDGFHYTLRDGAWVCVRFSGTEPIMRIYAEADTPGARASPSSRSPVRWRECRVGRPIHVIPRSSSASSE